MVASSVKWGEVANWQACSAWAPLAAAHPTAPSWAPDLFLLTCRESEQQQPTFAFSPTFSADPVPTAPLEAL